MKTLLQLSNNRRLLPVLFGFVMVVGCCSCSKNKDGVPEESKTITAGELEGYYIVTENTSWNPRMSLFYFGKSDGKTMVTQDGAGVRRGYEVNIIDNHLKIGSDGQIFDFLFEKASDGNIRLTSYSGSAGYAALYKNSASFPISGRTFSRKWEQVNGVLYHIGFNDTKFIDGIAGIIPEEGYPYYIVGNGAGWKSDTGYGSFMGAMVSSWKGNGKQTLLVEKRTATSPKIDVYTN